MADTHMTGPGISTGFNPTAGGDYNPDAGPNTSYQGDTFMDPRYPYQGGSGPVTSGNVSRATFFNTQSLRSVDAIPSTIATANIAALQAQTGGTALTLVTTTGAGITVTTAGAAIAGYPMMGSAPGLKTTAAATPTQALLAIDGLFAYLIVGRNAILDPTTAIARAVSLTSGGNLSAGTFTVRGYDLFGYKMTETITGPNANTVNGKKAWKYIQSVTPNTTSATTVSVGTTDIYGTHLRCDKWEDLLVFWNQVFLTTPAGAGGGVIAFADTTSPATATTGDVRGTYNVGTTASNGTRRLSFTQSPPVASMVGATFLNPNLLAGVPQYADF